MREITLEDREIITRCRNLEENYFTAFAFQSIYTWRNQLGLTIDGDDSFFVVHSNKDKAFFVPCGDQEKCRRWIDEKKDGGEYFKLIYLNEAQASELKKEGFTVKHMPNLSEYIYNSKALALEEGATRNFKRKCKKFDSSEYFARKIEITDVGEMKLLIRQWKIAGDSENDKDLAAMETAVDNMSRLNMKGVAIHTQNGHYAFVLGYENTPDCFTMSMVKYSRDMSPDVVDLCVHEFAKLLTDKYEKIDLEEDLGDEGLRRMKKLIGPCRMYEVYSAEYNVDKKYEMPAEPVKDIDFFCRRMFRHMFIPACFSSLGLAAANIIDAVSIGNRLGPVGVAAVGIVTPIYSIYNTIGYGFAVGSSVVFAKKMANTDEKGAIESFNSILETLLLFSILIAVLGNIFITPTLGLLGVVPDQGDIYNYSLQYARLLLGGMPVFMLNILFYESARYDDGPVLASIGFVTGSVLDVVLNILFVLVLGLGIRGMIVATLIAQLVSVLMILPHFFSSKFHLTFKPVKIDFKELAETIKVGFSTSARFILTFFFVVLANNFLMRSNLINRELYVAVFDVVLNVSYIVYCIYQAAVDAGQPLFSTFFAERDRKSAKETLNISLLMGLTVGILPTIFIAIFSPWVAVLFGMNIQSDIALAAHAIRVFLISSLVVGFGMILQGYCQSTNREKEALVYTLLRSFVILIPVTLVICLTNIELFWYILPISEIISSVLGMIYSRRKKSGWKIEDDKVLSYTLTSHEDIAGVIERSLMFCEDMGADDAQADVVTMVAEEICAVIIKKGFEGEKNEYIRFTLVHKKDGEFVLNLRDSAKDFNPFEMKTGKVSNSEEDMDLMDSMGILIIKQRAKSFYYRRFQGFNVLQITI